MIVIITEQLLNPNAVYMIIHHCVLWLLFAPNRFAHPCGLAFPLY
jgi:hypothetical protein